MSLAATRQEPDDPFAIKDCALAAISTGRRAQSLRELRDGLAAVPESCIYYHFWGGLLRPRFDDPEYSNDFAVWAYRDLHDEILAERLSLVDPTESPELEEIRQELIEVVEERLDEDAMISWRRADGGFTFVRSQIVVLDTHLFIRRPEELLRVVPAMSLGSVFYHFIDARRRTPGNTNDFSAWIAGAFPDYAALGEQLAALELYFNTLSELRRQIGALLGDYFGEATP